MSTETDSKTCRECGATKALSEFYRDSSGSHGRRGSCKTCMSRHHAEWRLANGRLSSAELRTPERERTFWSKVEHATPSDCWPWLGTINRYGYGEISWGAHTYKAHRIAFEWTRADIPDGLVIDHLCRNRSCVNPSHLEPVTNKENVLRGIGRSAVAARADHCPQGHPYDEANTNRTAGGRRCRACDRARNKAWQAVRVACPSCGVELAQGALKRHAKRHHTTTLLKEATT